MAEPKPVPGQILLTDAEFSTLVTTAAHNLRGVVGGDNDAIRAAGERMVRSTIQTLNEFRLGQPAGELRRSPAGSLAVREQDAKGNLSWKVVHHERADETAVGITDETIRRWSVIHDESWRFRLTVDDYNPKPFSE